jgi:hypothetical protein
MAIDAHLVASNDDVDDSLAKILHRRRYHDFLDPLVEIRLKLGLSQMHSSALHDQVRAN